jgi:hypothetical protein
MTDEPQDEQSDPAPAGEPQSSDTVEGVPVKNTVTAFLDKVKKLLTSEPARLIGYGSAIVIYLVANFLASKGIIDVKLSFEDSIVTALAAMSVLVGIVEAIRRAVYSPLTYIEDLADEAKNAHEAAHREIEFQDWFTETSNAIKEQLKADMEAIEATRALPPMIAKDQLN